MAETNVPRSGPSLSEEKLLAHFDRDRLARLLLALLPRERLARLTPQLKLRPVKGKRFVSMTPKEHAGVLAGAALEHPKPRRGLLTALAEALSDLPPPPAYLAEVPASALEDVVALLRHLPARDRAALVLTWLEREELVEAVHRACDEGELLAPQEGLDDKERADLGRRLDAAEKRARRAERRVRELEESERRDADRHRDLERRLEQSQEEVTRLQTRLGESHRETERLQRLVDRTKEAEQKAVRRAARTKRELERAQAPSERERRLEEDLREARRRAELAERKADLLEYLLDAHEHEVEEDDAPAAGPLPGDELPGRVARLARRLGRRPRVLVLGGAGKQRRQREERFPALLDHLGLEGEWRFADYRSWQKDLPRLINDLRSRFDLVFVLHWNRTTFVRKIHEEGRASGAHVRTVRYDGFSSLERALREELRKLLDKEGC